MRSLFLNFACILTLFNIEPPVHEKLEANFKDGFVRCVTISWPPFSDPPCVAISVFVKVVTDTYLKAPCSIQVPDNASL